MSCPLPFGVSIQHPLGSRVVRLRQKMSRVGGVLGDGKPGRVVVSLVIGSMAIALRSNLALATSGRAIAVSPQDPLAQAVPPHSDRGGQSALPSLSDPTPWPKTIAPARWEAAECQGQWEGFEKVSRQVQARLRCGWAIVPETRQAAEGVGGSRSIRLATVFYDAPATPAGDVPLVMAQGGPGGSTLALAMDWILTAQQPGLSQRDLLFVEQRGTQNSQPYLFCQELYQFDRDHLQELTSDTLEAARNQALVACRDRLAGSGIDLTAYNSLENAADLVATARALGFERFDFYGVSYGSALGQHLLRDAPEHLRAVVLDAVVPLDLSFAAESPRTGDRVLRLLFDRCAAETPCAREYPTLRQDFAAVVARLDAEPAEALVFDEIGYAAARRSSVDPAAAEEIDRNTFERRGRFDGRAFVNLLVGQAFYDSTLIPVVPEMLRELRSGENSPLHSLTGDLLSPFADAMYQSTVCRDDGEFIPQNRDFSDLLPELAFSGDDLESMRTGCRLWQVGSAEDAAWRRYRDRVRTPPRSAVPTLLLSGEFDPITPPPYAQRVAAGLSRSYQVEFPGLAHGVFATDPCATAIVRDFLNRPEQPPDVRCTANLGFAVQIPSPPRRFVPVQVPLQPVRWAVPAGWLQDASQTPNLWSSPSLVIGGLPDPNNDGSIQFMVAVGDRQVSVAVERLGFSFPLEPVGQRRVNGRLWTILAPVGRLYSVRVAATTVGDQTFMAVAEAERSRVRDAVLQGAIAGFSLVRP